MLRLSEGELTMTSTLLGRFKGCKASGLHFLGFVSFSSYLNLIIVLGNRQQTSICTCVSTCTSDLLFNHCCHRYSVHRLVVSLCCTLYDLVPYLNFCDLRHRHTRGWVPRVSHFILSGGWYGLLPRCSAPSQIGSFHYWIIE